MILVTIAFSLSSSVLFAIVHPGCVITSHLNLLSLPRLNSTCCHGRWLHSLYAEPGGVGRRGGEERQGRCEGVTPALPADEFSRVRDNFPIPRTAIHNLAHETKCTSINLLQYNRTNVAQRLKRRQQVSRMSAQRPGPVQSQLADPVAPLSRLASSTGEG